MNSKIMASKETARNVRRRNGGDMTLGNKFHRKPQSSQEEEATRSGDWKVLSDHVSSHFRREQTRRSGWRSVK